MEKNRPEQHSNEQPDKEKDIDRYERLQLSAERQLENVWKAYEKHSSLITKGVIVITLVGGFFFYTNIQGFKNDLRENIGAQLTNMTTKLDAEFASMTNRVEARIQEESRRVDAGIDERFRRENIESLIESRVQTNVDRVTDLIIAKNIQQQIDPALMKITNQLATVAAGLSDARVSSEELREVADLAMTIVDALNDDRRAFDKLIHLRDTGTNRYQMTIVRAMNTITAKLSNQDALFPGRALRWDFLKFKPDTASWDEYWKLWGTVGGGAEQSLLLQKISEQARFSRYEKLTIY